VKENGSPAGPRPEWALSQAVRAFISPAEGALAGVWPASASHVMPASAISLFKRIPDSLNAKTPRRKGAKKRLFDFRLEFGFRQDKQD
jgi:hypothetical protein